MKLPDGVRVIEAKVTPGSLELTLEVTPLAPGTITCPVCFYDESLHLPPFTGVCPPVEGRSRGEGAYVDRLL